MGAQQNTSLSTVYEKFFFDFNLEFRLLSRALVRNRWMLCLSLGSKGVLEEKVLAARTAVGSSQTLTITFKTVTTQGGTTMDSVTVDLQPGKIASGIEFSL